MWGRGRGKGGENFATNEFFNLRKVVVKRLNAVQIFASKIVGKRVQYVNYMYGTIKCVMF